MPILFIKIFLMLVDSFNFKCFLQFVDTILFPLKYFKYGNSFAIDESHNECFFLKWWITTYLDSVCLVVGCNRRRIWIEQINRVFWCVVVCSGIGSFVTDPQWLLRRLAGNQTKQNQNRISKIPFGRIRKKCCFRFLFDCLFFRAIVGLSGCDTRTHFCTVYAIVLEWHLTDDWLPPAPGSAPRLPWPHILYRSYIRSRSQKTDSIHPASPVRRYITSTKIGHKEWHPRLRNGIPVIILDPVIVV